MKPLFAILLAFAIWFGTLGALQPAPASDPIRLASVASLLTTLTVGVYRLGAWRQEMASNFASLDRRLEAIDHVVTEIFERSDRLTRWQARTERRLDRLEQHTLEVEA